MMKKIFYLLCSLCCLTAMAQQASEPKREFRGAWIQTVNGQFQGLTRDAMQANLTRQLDALARCRVNAIMFQVRCEGDALYPSRYEPWSRFLTGTQGMAPNPYWDPLEWMIEQCHRRGMELHAWINPYRAKTKTTTQLASTHPYSLHPERFFPYGGLLIFNPGLPENRRYICEIVSDILRRYDVDGIHMDDYFYPYPEAGTPIPDEDTFSTYGKGFTSIADWRRDNVSRLISELHDTIRAVKPWVKFGVSPFGIYHNQRSGDAVPGSNTSGLQNYDDLYADVLQWTNKGWVDYNIPQLYWEIGHPRADYDTLIRWWSSVAGDRPLFIGQDVERTVRTPDTKDATINQLPEKMRLQRTLPGIEGSCLWYSAAVAANTGNIATALETLYNRHLALQPLMPFIDSKAPDKVKGLKDIWTADGLMLVWLAPKAKTEMDRARQYVVYRFAKGEKKDLNDASHIVTITDKTYMPLPYADGKTKYYYVVTSLDRLQNESKGRSETVHL